MRTVSSCSVCRSRKKRCIATAAGLACQLCFAKGFRCDAPTINDRSPDMSRSLTRLAPNSQAGDFVSADNVASQVVGTTLKDRPLCEELIEIYFEVIHYKQHLLFHPASFLLDWKNGLIPQYIVLGILALAARFSTSPSFDQIPRWSRGKPFLREAINTFNQREKLISLQALQGCILLAFTAFSEGDVDQEALLNCQAVRMTQALQLPVTLSSDTLTREIEINLYWQVWMMDCWTSVRALLPQQLRNDASFPKPLREDIFYQLSPSSPANDDINSDTWRTSSLWGLMLPLHQWHAQVVKLNYDIVHEPAFDFRFRNLTRNLAAKLDHWVRNLPAALQNTAQNWRSYKDRGHGRTFAVMHVVYHHTCQLLFYPFLHKSVAFDTCETATVDEEVCTYAELCKAHATALSRLKWELNTAPDMDCLWSPVNSHLLVVASTVHLHTMLLRTDRPEAAEAKKLLEQNFVILQQHHKFWPSTELAFSRLQAFHNACRVSSISKTFNMDQWMANFLNRYDVSVEDRDINVKLVDLGASNRGDELWEMVFSNNEG